MRTTLVAIVPSMTQISVQGRRGTVRKWKSLTDDLMRLLPLADIELITNHVSRRSTQGAAVIAGRVSALIDGLWQRHRYQNVVLVGYSDGVLVVRRVYLDGRAARVAHDAGREWVPRVSRLVLFSGLSGVSSGSARMLLRLLAGRQFAADVSRGSAFAASLRLEWIQEWSKSGHKPDVWQLIGDEEDRNETPEIELFDTGAIETVRFSTRRTVFRVDLPRNGDVRNARRTTIEHAFLGTAANVPSPVRDRPHTVLFLAPGIRALAPHWTARATEIATQYGVTNQRNIVVIPADNIFVSAFDFLFSATRKRRALWLRDSYASAVARFPYAKQFAFLGHSNGTYALGKALRELPTMRFRRVALVGSVLPPNYDWRSRCHNHRQIFEMLNHCSRYDWPVGLVCRTLNLWRISDVGTGGIDGFDDERRVPEIRSVRYYNGGHSAPIKSGSNLEKLVHWSLGAPVSTYANDNRGPSPYMTLAGRVASIASPILLLGPLLWAALDFVLGKRYHGSLPLFPIVRELSLALVVCAPVALILFLLLVF